MHNVDRFLDAVGANPGAAALFSDFDGTLAPILDDPAAVTPTPGVVERMDALSERLGRVAVVSGRPVSFLEGIFGERVELSGLYGIEHRTGGRTFVDQSALEWLPAMRTTAARAVEEFGEAAVENKTYSLTLHHRTVEDPAKVARMRAWVLERADLIGLEARTARMSFELHPPLERSKADAVADMLPGIGAALYVGDDVGDRPAFHLLAQRLAAGDLRAGATVLVESDESDSSLRPVVTETVGGPHEIPALLDRILAVC